MSNVAYLPGLNPSPVTVEAIDRKASSRFLIDWGHNLGPCERPFGQDQWLLICSGRPVSLAVTASIVSPHILDDETHDSRAWARNETVELARLCSNPAASWATRVMLRLWREVLSREWTHWTPQLLASYSQNDRHDGRLYRFDGWRAVRTNAARSTGGGTWTKKRGTDHAANGEKTLWLYELEAAA